MPEIAEKVRYNTLAREWRMKWADAEDKLSLTQVQEVLESLIEEISAVPGIKSVQRVVCGGCLDYKVVISLPEKKFEAWKEKDFAPEATFLDAVKKIGGVSKVETQTYTISDVRLRPPIERRRDPTDPLSAKTYTKKEFEKFYGPEQGDRLWKKAAKAEADAQRRLESARNSAFVFIKPHANTEEVRKLVKDALTAKGIKIQKEGSLKSEIIDKKKLIDQHYYSIASKATLLKPSALNVPADKFKEQFGLGWDEALAKGNVYNAKDACEKLGLDADGLDKLWAAAKKAKKMIKFGGGFYCGLIEAPEKDPIYVFNGFFMSMRSKFTVPGESIHYYVVHWDPKDLSWADFRGKLLGATDPKDAPAESLRGIVLKDWQKLGLKSEPNVGDNGVHASASPFEGLAERMNWLRGTAETDHFGKLLLANGVPPAVIKKWSVDPQIMVDAGGKMGSMFDSVEDLDATDCAKKCAELSRINKPARKERGERKERPEKKERPKSSRIVKE